MATKQIAWTTGSGYITLTYNGQGNGTITVSSDDNTGVAREQIITIETTAGTPVVTKNITIRQEAYVPPIQNFSYTGTVQSCTLPPGTYRLQCWGAQGSANDADATYGITSQAGGKGGYSEGILKLNSATTVYIFVGGQPANADNKGGWNGGGGGNLTASHGTTQFGYTKYGKGGGGTDIALVTSTITQSGMRTVRSSESLLSRFIVAGGGSGGAMCLQRTTTTTTSWEKVSTTIDLSTSSGTWNGYSWSRTRTTTSGTQSYVTIAQFAQGACPMASGHYKAVWSGITQASVRTRVYWSGTPVTNLAELTTATGVTEVTREFDFEYDAAPSASHRLRFQIQGEGSYPTCNLEIYKQVSETVVTDTYDSQVGYAGGGTEGEGYISSGGTHYAGTQNSSPNAGSADFGLGGNQTYTAYRAVAPAGGGGWYGGGCTYGDAVGSSSGIHISGAGSGFVNTPASASNRPQDYTGIELDSGNTYVGNISNPSTTNGIFETGHAGNGYARITRMGSWKAELPTGYTLVEYIENVSSAYINTGVNAANDIGIHIEYEDNYTYGSSSNYVVGARATSSSTILIGISGSSSGNTSNISYNGSSVNLGVTRSKGKKYVVDLQADSTGLDYRYVIDGSESKTGRITKTLSATSTPICLFGFNSSNIKKNTRINRCYITDGDDVVRYFLPCKNASNVVGLYDCVNEVFYGSSNSYTFTAGPNIN